MTTSVRTRFLMMLFILAGAISSAHANEDAARPGLFNLNLFVQATVDMAKPGSAAARQLLDNTRNSNTNSVCVCEIVELQNNNAQFSDVAIFAEKTNNGDLGREYKIAEQKISKEKKQMKAMFFEKVKTQTKIAATSNCFSLYLQLKGRYPELKLYDILNGNINK